MATFTNQATLTYNGRTVASNLVTGQVISPLTLTKTAGEDAYRPGDTVSYVVSVVNDGSVNYEGLTLTDDLGAYGAAGQTAYPLAYVEDSLRYFINGVPQPAPQVTPGDTLTVTGISVPAGGNAMLVYETEITGAAPLTAGGEIVNTAVLTGPGINAPLEAQASIAAEETAELTVTKSLYPATVAENGLLTYTFCVQNSGNQAAGEDAAVAVSDLFDPILKDITVTLDGETLSAGTDYTYDAASGQFDTAAGRITVPAAVFAQTLSDGSWTVTPGEAVLTVQGTV